jgi:L-alanine-DL-glutamate epimerase-like enolase superfamily enzyme
MLTYFQGRGGIGLVIDGWLRDFPNAKTLDLAPGHGLTLNEDVARAHLKPGSSFFGEHAADRKRKSKELCMKITGVRCALIGQNPVVRIVTDAGIDGLGPVEHTKPYIKPHVLHLRDALIGEDPTNVERVMLKIRERGAFKPFGAAVSAIEIALWYIAGKAAGEPIYKLLGGKVRDRVRVYNGAIREPMTKFEPEDCAESVRKMKAAPHGFTIVKQGIGFHSGMKSAMPGFHYGEGRAAAFHGQLVRGPLTERGLTRIVECVAAMKAVLGDEIGLALDCGPGMRPTDALRLAKAVEPYNLMWLEDMITGDYVPFVDADVYRDVTRATATPIHTGEQIYLRQNFKQLIEGNAVNVVGPDPCDVGGLAELLSAAGPGSEILSVRKAPAAVRRRRPAGGGCPRLQSGKLYVSFNQMLKTQHFNFERHFCPQALAAVKTSGTRCLAHGLLDLPLRCDANDLQELSNGDIKLVFVHLCSPLRRLRVESGGRRARYGQA